MDNTHRAHATVGELAGLLDSYFPPALAESWDRVGLAVGDPAAQVRTVMFAVDPVSAIIDEALQAGADLLVTHHPLLLRPVSSVAATTFKGAAVHRLIAGGCALYTAHTNADAAPGGVADALATAVGVRGCVPVVPAPGAAMDKVVAYVPVSHTDAVRRAMAQAGAGHLGEYSEAAWQVRGLGRFTPGAGAHPHAGTPGVHEVVEEDRVEMIVPRGLRAGVVAALRAAHPYEEPAFDVIELASLPAGSGLGRVGSLAAPMSLADFAGAVLAALPRTAHGVRVAGDPTAQVRRIAVLAGAGDSLFDEVRATGADVYLTADLRHHPASEQQEHARLLGQGRPYLVDVSHAASEGLWLAGTAERVCRDLAAQGITVKTTVSTKNTDPWTFRLG